MEARTSPAEESEEKRVHRVWVEYHETDPSSPPERAPVTREYVIGVVLAGMVGLGIGLIGTHVWLMH